VDVGEHDDSGKSTEDRSGERGLQPCGKSDITVVALVQQGGECVTVLVPSLHPVLQFVPRPNCRRTTEYIGRRWQVQRATLLLFKGPAALFAVLSLLQTHTVSMLHISRLLALPLPVFIAGIITSTVQRIMH